MASAEMRDVLRKEETRLEGLLASLARDWNSAPKLLVLSVLAVPAGVAFGAVWGAIVAALVVSLAGTVLYLVGVRQKEYQHELDAVRKQLAALGDTP